MADRRLARVAGELSILVASTKSRPPASVIGARVVSSHTDRPRGTSTG